MMRLPLTLPSRLVYLTLRVIYWAYKRLNSGLSETLRMRLRVLHSVTM